MDAVALTQPRLPPGALVITPEISFRLSKAGFDVARFGAYHASQDTRFRDFTTGGSPTSSRREEDYFPRYDRAKVIARARVAFRNNPWLAAPLLAYAMEMGTPTLKSQTGDESYDDAKERLWERWALDCEADEDLSIEEVVEIFWFEECIAGELFIVKRLEGWLQLIASELCGSPQSRKQLIPAGAKFSDGTAVPAGATERDGVVRDSANLIIGYRFGTRDDQGSISFAPDRSTIVPKKYVWHLASRQRTEQGRGVPLLAPVLNSMQDLFETAEARAQQVKNAACLSLWVTKNIDPYGFAQTMQGTLRTGDIKTAAELKEQVAQRSGYQQVKAGSIYYGAAGEELQLIEPKLNAPDFHDHYIDLAQICCACLNGLPVEIALEGFRDSNYSSARATVNKWKRNVQRSRRRLERKFLDPLQLWQANRWRLFGELGAPPAPARPSSVSYSTDENVRWGWPPTPDIDAAKTAATNAMELANGTTSLEAIYADKGLYAPDEMKVIAKERARFVQELIEQAKAIGFDDAQARAWALAQTTAGAGVSALLGPIVANALAPAAPEPAKP
jgi:capsid protein